MITKTLSFYSIHEQIPEIKENSKVSSKVLFLIINDEEVHKGFFHVNGCFYEDGWGMRAKSKVFYDLIKDLPPDKFMEQIKDAPKKEVVYWCYANKT